MLDHGSRFPWRHARSEQPDILCYSFYLKIYLFLAMLGLRCYARAFSSCGEQGLLFLAVHRLLIAVAFLVAEHGL